MEIQIFFDEIIDLHKFIQDWLTGSVPKTEEAYSRLRDVLDENFIIVNPAGVATPRNEIIKSFWSAHCGQEKNFTIEIRNLNHRITFGDYALFTYEEWQFGQSATSRISSVLFRKSAKGNRVRWVHLHETWIST
jgi:hypothetical protein